MRERGSPARDCFDAAASSVAARLARAFEAGERMRPRGSGTWWRDAGGPFGTALELGGLDAVRAVDAPDLVASVEAGCGRARLAGVLAREGVWTALDGPGGPQRSVGGLLATGAPGPLAARYGPPRGQVLGLTVVMGDGRAARLGGRVVKNVAGFDVGSIVIGGHGAFGIIVGAQLRVRALPAADRTIALEGARDAVARTAARALSSGAVPAALEVVSPGLSTALGVGEEWTLLVRDLGVPAAVDEELAVVSRAAAGRLRTREVEPGPVLWDRWGRAVGEWPTVLRIGADPSTWQEAVALALSHVGAGSVASVTVPRGTVRLGAPPVAVASIRRLRSDAAGRGWPVVLERADATTLDEAGVVGALPLATLRLTESLRVRLDPRGVLAVPFLG